MNLLTIDIEDWYNCDFITPDFNWNKYEVRIYEGVDRILQELSNRNLRATFFCLGWVAKEHPEVIKSINTQGHHIGCHSYQHELASRFDIKGFKQDTEKAKKLIEDVIGESVNSFRAPGWSINEHNIWALDVLVELGFEIDCSIFPVKHDYGGFISFGDALPTILRLPSGAQLKEFPINIKKIFGKNIVFSGGGFFRFFPYLLIKYWALKSPYLMTYFHPRDFDPGQPIVKTLPLTRKFKSYFGLSTSFAKFKRLLDDFEFLSVEEASSQFEWEKARVIQL